MANLLVVGAVSLDRPVWIDRPLVLGGRLRGRSQDGMLAPRLGGGGPVTGKLLRGYKPEHFSMPVSELY